MRHGSARGFDQVPERLLHVPGLQQLVIAPFEMEAQNGNSPLIDDIGVDFAIAVLIGDHFTSAREVNFASVELAEIALEFDTVAASEPAFGVASEHTRLGLRAPAADLNVIAASKGQLSCFLLLVEPPGHIEMHAADTVLISRRKVLQNGKESADG